MEELLKEQISHDVIYCDEGRCKPEFKDECDINNTMKRFEQTGVLPDAGYKEPMYLDCTSVPDFISAQKVVAKVNQQFEGMSAEIQNKFGNAENMLDWVSNPENEEEAVKLGLLTSDKSKTEPETTEEKIMKKESSVEGEIGSARVST